MEIAAGWTKQEEEEDEDDEDEGEDEEGDEEEDEEENCSILDWRIMFELCLPHVFGIINQLVTNHY